MTRIKAAAMALACLLAGCSATASQEVPRTEPYNVGQGGIEACTEPGRQGECSMVKNVRLMLLSGTWVDGIGSFYKVALPDQTEVWVRGVDLLGLKPNAPRCRGPASRASDSRCAVERGIARVPSSASWTAMPQLSSSMAVTTPP